ncbi:MAG: MBL fold metallo-hydrolase [Promethearchaeota archaeon]
MRIIFLGTNGWYATDLGNTISTLIDSKNYYIILDAGDGIYKIDQYIKEDKPIIILLSHLHLDHVIGFHAFAKFLFNQKINVFGYKGTIKGLKKIINHPYSAPFGNIPVNVQIHDLEEGNHNIGFSVKCNLLLHADPCLGYRIELDNKIIAYCTDTGMTPALIELAQDADLLIIECSYKPGQEEWGWPHLKAEEAAEIAKNSKVKQLILTHFDASYYKTAQDRKLAEEKAQKIFQNTRAAIDGFELIL